MTDIFDVTITKRCQILLAAYLSQGDTAVDCTCGNGYDTLFLCRSVGREGKVYAFDIQEKAIEHTRELLQKEGWEAELFLSSHVRLADLLSDRPARGSGKNLAAERPVREESAPAVIMYNLGYLPGGDHRLCTRTEETLSSVSQALELLKKGGVLSLVAYPGHEEGRKEAEAVHDLLAGLPPKDFEVLTLAQTNRSALAPVLYLVHKRQTC